MNDLLRRAVKKKTAPALGKRIGIEQKRKNSSSLFLVT